MLTATDLLTTCGAHEERLAWVSPAVESNAHGFVEKVNALLMRFGEERKLTSGFRDLLSNKKAGGSPYSWHLFGLAADLEDRFGTLGVWVLENQGALASIGLYAEHPDSTNGWVHVQSVAPRSGKVVFWP